MKNRPVLNRPFVPSSLLCGVVGLAALAMHGQASAQDVGRVISSTAIISQVSVPRQVCAQEVVQVQNQVPASKSGAGALMGGIAGGALGNAVGQGTGRAAATLLGVLGGAILGDKVEGGSPAQVATTQQTVNRCTTQNFLENRTAGYQVVYEYAGKQYSVQMPNDPGPTIQLQIAPAAATLPAPAAVPAPAAPAPRVVSQAEPQVIVQQAAEPVYNATVITSGTVYQPYVVAAPYYYPSPVFGTSLIIRGGSGYYGNAYRHGHRW
jgi:uncharacterized protein YcfJ